MVETETAWSSSTTREFLQSIGEYRTNALLHYIIKRLEDKSVIKRYIPEQLPRHGRVHFTPELPQAIRNKGVEVAL
ncbi:MAG: hypothetical protein ACLRXC_12630 [[Clostridium] leptum]